ncbi:MAG: hypothetical protein IJ584_13115 [Bacteroidales bacterium]|nr:hypothetical protein [Bacteroidales bacterium]
MRRYIIILMLAIMATSCSVMRTPARLNNFVNRVERNADRYTSADWERVGRQYDALVQEYTQNYRRFTTEEKRMAMQAIGRYHGLLVEHGIKRSVSFVGNIAAYAGALIDILKKDFGAAQDFLKDVLGMGSRDADNALSRLKKLAE